MSSSLRNLGTATRRYEASEQGQIEYVGVSWPAFANFEEALSQYIDSCDGISYEDDRTSELQALRLARHRLSRLPIHPDHEIVGLNGLNLAQSNSTVNAIDVSRNHCLNFARDLLRTRHPAASLYDLLGINTALMSHDVSRIAIVSPELFHEAIRESINFGQINYELVSQSQLKHRGVWDLVIYLGPQYSSYPGTPLIVRKRQVAWMYSAPAASRTIQVIWSGGFDIADYTIWSESPLSLRKSEGPTRFTVFIDEESHLPPPALPPVIASTDGVSGYVIDLAGGYRVALSSDYGPRPHVIQTSDFSVSIEADSTDQLVKGDTILLRVDRTAREFVVKSALTKLGKSTYERAAAASATFKNEVAAKYSENPTESESRLHSAGIANSAYYFNACSDGEYIAPGELDRYRLICTTLNIAHSEEDFKLFSKMRSAHRKAGAEARELIQDQLKNDRRWEDETREQGFCTRNFTNLGNILIAAIITITPQTVSLSSLGRVQKDGNYVD